MKKLKLKVCHYSGHTEALSSCSFFYNISPSESNELRLIQEKMSLA